MGQHYTQVKALCNVVQEDPDNNAQEKILLNVVLILSGQHCTSKGLVQCCPRGCRQHCTDKNPVQYCLNTYFWNNIPQVNTSCNVVLETPGNIAQEKILFNAIFILLGQHYTGKKTQCNVVWTSLFGNFCFGLVNFSIINGCCNCRQHCRDFPDIAQEKSWVNIEQKG